MKKLSLILALILFTVLAFAQTGLFNIAFDQTREEVKTSLEGDDYGFTEDDYADHVSTFINDNNEYIDHILVIYNPDTEMVVGWQVYYIDQDEEDIADVAYEACSDWHGESDSFDDDLGVDYWDLGNGRTLRLGYNYDLWMLAEYLEEGYEDYSEF